MRASFIRGLDPGIEVQSTRKTESERPDSPGPALRTDTDGHTQPPPRGLKRGGNRYNDMRRLLVEPVSIGIRPYCKLAILQR